MLRAPTVLQGLRHHLTVPRENTATPLGLIRPSVTATLDGTARLVLVLLARWSARGVRIVLMAVTCLTPVGTGRMVTQRSWQRGRSVRRAILGRTATKLGRQRQVVTVGRVGGAICCFTCKLIKGLFVNSDS